MTMMLRLVLIAGSLLTTAQIIRKIRQSKAQIEDSVFWVFVSAVLILFSNAYLIGVMGAYYRINALSIPAFLAGILPHGVFELTALALGAAIGFTICLTLVKKILHTPGTPPMRELVSDGLRTLLLVVLPLLVCAAVVEAYLTPQIMELFF